MTNQLPEITESSFTYVVLMEDEILHTAENGYRCSDSSCPCAADAAAAMEQESPDAMAASEAWLFRQQQQHLEDRHYFSAWGLHAEEV